MKIKNMIRVVVHILFRWVRFGSHRHTAPSPPPEQLDLRLDQITGTGLRLREALPVRSAECWLQLGEPDLALKQLETLPESTRRHEWPLRVELDALHTASR